MLSQLSKWLGRIRSTLRSSQLELDLTTEVEAHRAMRQADLERRGASADEASRVSRSEMGSQLALRESAREIWFGTWDAWRQDVQHAYRGLCRAPAFTITTAGTLAIGLTGALAMFVVIDTVLLQPLPVPEEARVLVGWRALSTQGARHWPFRSVDLDLLRRESRTLTGVAGTGYTDPTRVALVDREASSFAAAARVTGEFFEILRVRPLLGRSLQAADDVRGAENVIVLSNRLWRAQFGASPQILGHSVLINDQTFTVVGVMPPGVEYPVGTDLWMTVAAMETATNPVFREAMRLELNLLARMRDGASFEEARKDLAALSGALQETRMRGDPEGLVPIVDSLRNVVVGDARRVIILLFAAVGLVLLVACANAANLMLLRGDVRRHEFAMRVALGAGPGRIVRQVVVESAVLVALAGLGALCIVAFAGPVALLWLPQGLPRLQPFRFNLFVVGFAVCLVATVTSLAGLVPALTAVRVAMPESRRSTGLPRSVRSRRILVALQVALTCVVVGSAAVLTRSLVRLHDVGYELDADKLVYVPLAFPPAYPDGGRHRLLAELSTRLGHSTPIVAATPVNLEPFSGLGWDVPTFTAESQSVDRARDNPTLHLEEIHPSYFSVFAVTVLQGRAFTADDGQSSVPVAIISRDVAEKTWPGADPIGKRLKMGAPDSRSPWLTIVGVSTPTRYRDVTQRRATLYVPAAQMLNAAHDIVVRTVASPPIVADVVRGHLRELDSQVRVMPPRPFAALLDVPLARPRVTAALALVFGASALLLVAVGLYAVIAASVRQRRQEFGVRIALGATSSSLRRLVMTEGMVLVGLGGCVGLFFALAATPLMRELLFDTSPMDPVAVLGAAGTIVIVAGVALLLPVRGAAHFDVARLLRSD